MASEAIKIMYSTDYVTYISIRGCVSLLGVTERPYVPLAHSHFGILADPLLQLNVRRFLLTFHSIYHVAVKPHKE